MERISPPSRKLLSCVVYLRDGRIIDMQQVSPEEALDALRKLGVTTDDIKETRHSLKPKGEDRGDHDQ